MADDDGGTEAAVFTFIPKDDEDMTFIDGTGNAMRFTGLGTLIICSAVSK